MIAKNRSKAEWLPSSTEGRWAKLGPYYAMFPVEFVRQTVERLCPVDGGIIDPFCGRGTVPFVAKATGRSSLGIDLNPVGYVYSATKTDPETDASLLIQRVQEIADSVRPKDCHPENDFQQWAWCPPVLGFIRSARRLLKWRDNRTDRTLMAIILVHLHGRLGSAVSNQMRQSKSMAPDYAVRWWRKRRKKPPRIDPVDYFSAKIEWRYAKGIVLGPESKIILGDSRDALLKHAGQNYSMLLTSPPYYGITNYRVDNWIRLWLLGDPPLPNWETSQRYEHRERYREMLQGVFKAARDCLVADPIVYVRTDSRSFTHDTTLSILQETWPNHRVVGRSERPLKSQTQLFGDLETKPGETDFVLLPPGGQQRLLGFRKVHAPRLQPARSRTNIWSHDENIAPTLLDLNREVALQNTDLSEVLLPAEHEIDADCVEQPFAISNMLSCQSEEPNCAIVQPQTSTENTTMIRLGPQTKTLLNCVGSTAILSRETSANIPHSIAPTVLPHGHVPLKLALPTKAVADRPAGNVPWHRATTSHFRFSWGRNSSKIKFRQCLVPLLVLVAFEFLMAI